MRVSAQQLIFLSCGLMALAGGLALATADGMAQQSQPNQPPQQGRQLQPQPLQQGQPQLQPQPLQQGQPQQSQPARQGQQQGPAWTKLCGKLKAAAEGQEQPQDDKPTQDDNLCLTFQELLNNKDGRFLASAGIRQQGGKEARSLVITVPLGVDLHGGPQVRVDGGKPIKLDYARCHAAGCTADGEVTTEFVTAMRGGKKIAIEVKGPLGKPISLTLPLTGFAAAYDGQASDATQYQMARQKLVNAIRARRAEEVNKALQSLDKQQEPPPQ